MPRAVAPRRRCRPPPQVNCWAPGCPQAVPIVPPDPPPSTSMPLLLALHTLTSPSGATVPFNVILLQASSEVVILVPGRRSARLSRVAGRPAGWWLGGRCYRAPRRLRDPESLWEGRATPVAPPLPSQTPPTPPPPPPSPSRLTLARCHLPCRRTTCRTRRRPRGCGAGRWGQTEHCLAVAAQGAVRAAAAGACSCTITTAALPSLPQLVPTSGGVSASLWDANSAEELQQWLDEVGAVGHTGGLPPCRPCRRRRWRWPARMACCRRLIAAAPILAHPAVHQRGRDPPGLLLKGGEGVVRFATYWSFAPHAACVPASHDRCRPLAAAAAPLPPHHAPGAGGARGVRSGPGRGGPGARGGEGARVAGRRAAAAQGQLPPPWLMLPAASC